MFGTDPSEREYRRLRDYSPLRPGMRIRSPLPIDDYRFRRRISKNRCPRATTNRFENAVGKSYTRARVYIYLY